MSVFVPAVDAAPAGGGLVHLVLAAPTSLPWFDRRRLAAAMNSAATRTNFLAHASAGPEGVSLVAAVTPDAVAELVDHVDAWMVALTAEPAPPPLPVTSVSDLLTALTFETSGEAATEAEIRGALAALDLRAVVVGDAEPTRLDTLQVGITAVIGPRGASETKARMPLGRTGRRWACSPVGGSWVRWVRPLPPPADEEEHLARSLVNILFGGISRSPFQETIRRHAGLSYDPRSELARLDGQHALVLDVPTAPGSEDEVDRAIADALAQFARSPLTEEGLRNAATHLLGRTILERDAAVGLAGERAAIHLGVISGLLDDNLSPDHLARTAAGAEASRIVAELFEPDGFDALVLSPNRPLPTTDWIPL